MTAKPFPAFAELLEAARTAAATGNTVRARACFRTATELNPTSHEAWLGFAATALVLAERRTLYQRALALDPTCADAQANLAQIDALVATGRLIRPRTANAAPAPAEVAFSHAAHPLASLVIPLPVAGSQPRRRHLGLLAVAAIGVATMGMLTMLSMFVLTSFWGLVLACMAGPCVSEVMLWLTDRVRKGLGGPPLQIAVAVGMILGGLGALALGTLLVQSLGLPVPAGALAMAHQVGAGVEPLAVLLNSPGLLIFVGSAVAATSYRLE